MAHRFYYEKAYGEIPAGIVIDHKCRTRSCVRPDHLQAVTTTENARLVRARMKPLVSRERVKEVLISELRAAGVPAPEEVARRVVEGLFLGTEAWGEC